MWVQEHVRGTGGRRALGWPACLALAGLAAGCTGVVSTTPNPGGNAGSGSTGATAGGSAGGTGNAGGGMSLPSGPLDPGVGEMHRLNTVEYNATVADVLGTQLQPATANWRAGGLDTFDNIASQLGVDDNQYLLYLDAAEALANDVFASDALRARIVTCTTSDDAACVSSIVSKTGLRVFRRPLLEAELSTYGKAYKSARAMGDDHAASLKQVLWSMLASAEFLYRMEFDGAETGKHPISGYELASRLSYFLWSSAPDDALLAAASTLNTDDALSRSVDRLLIDSKSSRFVKNFAGQWLGARKVQSHPAAPDVYGAWTPEVANAASAEMLAYFDEFLRNDRPWLDFLKADVNFVNAALAPLYGMPNISGTALQRVESPTDNRAGFMGLAGFLAVTSVDRRSAPTLRGKFVLLNLLCSPTPPAPPTAGKLEDKGDPTKLNIRDVLAKHRAAPGCGSCHNIMDPFGLALENYDGIGQLRAVYPNGTSIDPSTELPKSASFPAGIQFSGLSGAQDAISSDPRFKECITQKLISYGIGRSLSEDDKKSATLISAKAAEGGLTIKKVIRSIALAEPFRYRNAADAAK